jgi:hypothetical protein
LNFERRTSNVEVNTEETRCSVQRSAFSVLRSTFSNPKAKDQGERLGMLMLPPHSAGHAFRLLKRAGMEICAPHGAERQARLSGKAEGWAPPPRRNRGDWWITWAYAVGVVMSGATQFGGAVQSCGRNLQTFTQEGVQHE